MSVLESTRGSFFKEIIENPAVLKYTKSKNNLDLNKILLVDSQTMVFLREIVKQSDLTEKGFITVQDIQITLQPMQLHIFYFIIPSPKNIDTVIKHFDQENCPFLTCHIFSARELSDSVIDKIKSSSKLLSRLRTLTEVPFSFTAELGNLFTLSPQMTIPWVYDLNKKAEVVTEIAQGILDVLLTMNDNPCVRFMARSKYAPDVAEKLVSLLKGASAKNIDFGKSGSIIKPCQLLILDRSFDCRTPFMHDLSLEPMARDLLEIKNNKFDSNSKSKDSLKLFLNSTEPFWLNLKYKHIADASVELNEKMTEFKKTRKLDIPDGNISASALRKILQKYPAYRDEFKKIQTYIALADSCMERYRTCNLQDIVKAEQDLATNENEQGQRVPDNPALYANLLEDMKLSNDKLRLLVLFALKNGSGLSKDLIEKLVKLTSVEYAKKCLASLECLDFPIVEDSIASRNGLTRCSHDESVTSGYELSRYIPNIWDILKQSINQRLDEQKYPFFGEKNVITIPSESSGNAFEFGKYSKRTNAQTKKTRPRIYIFIIGGACYSELRLLNCAETQFPSIEVLLGATELLTPNSFITHLRNM